MVTCPPMKMRVWAEEVEEQEGQENFSCGSRKLTSPREQDPIAKVLKTKKKPVLKKRLMAIYRSIVTKMDDDRRFLCELFMKRPSASMYPQYYLVIKNPIDLKEILQRIRSETYLSMEELVSDVELMVENACTFNEEDSQVYKVKREGR